MTLIELEEKLKQENLLKINDWGIEKKYRKNSIELDIKFQKKRNKEQWEPFLIP